MYAPEDMNIAEVGYRTGSVFRVDVQRSRATGLKIEKRRLTYHSSACKLPCHVPHRAYHN